MPGPADADEPEFAEVAGKGVPVTLPRFIAGHREAVGQGVNSTESPIRVKLFKLQSISPRLKKLAVWTAALLFLYTVLGFLLLPPLVRAIAVKELSKYLGRPVSIQALRLNPYKLSASIRGLLIKDLDGAPMLSWDEAQVNFQLASLFTHAWIFKEVDLSQPFLCVQVNKDYRLTFSDIVDKLSQTAALSFGKTGKPRPWRISRLHLSAGKVTFTDLTPRMPFHRTAGQLEITVTNFQTDSDQQNTFALSGISAGGERIAWHGSFSLAPLRSQGEISLDGFALTTYAPLYQDLFRFEIKSGVIDLHSSYRYENSAAAQLLAVTNTTLGLKSFQMVEKDTGQAAAEISNLALNGGSLDAMTLQAEADRMAVTGGRFVLRRNKDTSVNVLELLRPADTAPPVPGGILLLLRAVTNLFAMLLNTTNLSNGTICDLDFTNCALHLEDLVNSAPVRLDLEGIAIHGRNISNRTGTNMTAEVSLLWDTNGIVRAGIQAGLSPPSAEVKLEIENLNLRPLSPYLEPHLDLFVLGSKLGLSGTVRLRNTREELPEVRFLGNARLDEFSTASGNAKEGLLQWNSLRLSGIEAHLNPPYVSVVQATLADVFGRLLIETNRTLNLTSVWRRGGTNVVAALPATNAAAPWPKVSLALVVVTNANVQFIDHSIWPNVNITLEHLNGTLSDLSSDAPQQGDLHLEGIVDYTARAEVTGKINPWNSKQPLNLKISLQSMNLLPGDPYASKYLGYRLTKGKLSAQLSYEVTERKLKSENHLTIDQLTLGQKVESPDATGLPVRLAIAILKDRDGRMVLDVPVNGTFDDPQFNLGQVVYQALKTVLTRIVTSPFSALSALFGGKGEELSFLEFQPGSTNLSLTAIAKLDVVANGLYEHPALQLEIEGSADPLTDLAALRHLELNRSLLAPKWNAGLTLSLAETSAEAPAATLPARSSRKAFSFEKGSSAIRKPAIGSSRLAPQTTVDESPFLQNTTRAYADDKGATALMLIFAPVWVATGSDLDPEPLESEQVAAEALRTLATDRARNIRAYLLETGKVESQRITESHQGSSSKGSRVYLRLQ